MDNTFSVSYPDDGHLLSDGFNGAIIGIEDSTFRVIYSVCGIIEILVQQGMEEEKAYEHLYYTMLPANAGENSPIFCNDNFKSS
jgi:hypothetical protein